MINGQAIGGSLDQCLITIKTGEIKYVHAHELAHFISLHPFDAIPLESLHPKVLEAVCDPVSHGDELITSLSYPGKCQEMGFPATDMHQYHSRGEWGPLDLTLAKLSTHREHDDTHAQIHAEGVDKSYEWIQQNYGHRVAEHFMGSFVKSVFVHTMSAVAVRSITDKRMLRLSKLLIHTFGNLLHLGMMNRIYIHPLALAVHGLAGQGWKGKTARALVDVAGDAPLLHSFVQLMQGNSDYMKQMVSATCGAAAGNAFSQLIHGFIEMCAPTNAQQRSTYIEMSKPTGMWGLIMDEAMHFRDGQSRIEVDQAVANFASRLPNSIRAIIDFDKAVADIIQHYVSLQVMTSWLWKKDQQTAEAQVQTSIDKLSATLGEVKTKFGPSDLPRVPSNTRSFGLTQSVPPLDLDRETDDDPLLFMDGAAVTGIGSAQAVKQQKKLGQKKQQ